MHKLVVRPLKEHLYKLFVDEYTRNGAIQLLHENINYARTKPLYDLGIKVSMVFINSKEIRLKTSPVVSLQSKRDHIVGVQ